MVEVEVDALRPCNSGRFGRGFLREEQEGGKPAVGRRDAP